MQRRNINYTLFEKVTGSAVFLCWVAVVVTLYLVIYAPWVWLRERSF